MYRVLVIDDDKEVWKLFRAYFNHNKKYEFLFASHGFDALETINLYRFDLFVIDIEMPFLDGFELARRIRASWKSKTIPIVFISSRNTAHDVARAAKLGVAEYLVKPFKMKAFEEKIERLLLYTPAFSKSQVNFEAQRELAQIEIRQDIKIECLSETGIHFSSPYKVCELGTELVLHWPRLLDVNVSSVRLTVTSESSTNSGFLYTTNFSHPSYELINLLHSKILKVGEGYLKPLLTWESSTEGP